MSAWERRGIQLGVRLKLGYDLLEWNNCESWTKLTDVIQVLRPDLPRETVYKAVHAWHEAMYDPDEGKAV